MNNIKIILTFLVLNCSCGLFEEIPENIVPIPGQFAALCVYKVGSYWIYHNDSLNIDDTFKVVKHESTIHTVDSNTGYEYLMITYYESYTKCQLLDCILPHSYIRKYNNAENNLTPHVNFVVGFNSQSVYEPQAHDTIEMLSDYSSNNITYDIVYKVKSLLYHNTNEYDENYIAQSKGIIKMVRYVKGNRIEWNLKKSKIIQ